ncbi:MAG: hypothetical protein R2867_26415 [Caldilineaceae bacterium]
MQSTGLVPSADGFHWQANAMNGEMKGTTMALLPMAQTAILATAATGTTLTGTTNGHNVDADAQPVAQPDAEELELTL